MATAIQPGSSTDRPRRESVRSIRGIDLACGFCATGCGLTVESDSSGATRLVPAVDYPVNDAAACPKGWEALAVLESPDRGTTPLLRDVRGRVEPLSWSEAVFEFCRRMKAIQDRHGRDSIAFIGSGQLPTEEQAFLGALAKFGMGMVHGDSNTRQCMATAVAAHKESFGFDAPSYCYDDLEQSDVVILIGSNLCVAHPILWQRVRCNRRSPWVVVVDPRRTETAMAADEHVALIPKSDLVLLYGLANELIGRGWIDADFIDRHTSGFAEFAQHVAPLTLDVAAARTGVAREQLERLARRIHEGERVSFWWTMGVNQSYEGVRTAQAIIDLALMTGQIGRPGTGAHSITGQCNAMGGRLFGNTTTLLGGHDFANPEHRRRVASHLGIPLNRVPVESGRPYHQILEGILRGEIRGLWVVGTNPAHSWIHQGQFRDVIGRLEFLVVQDMYRSTETARLADLYLPAAGWGEKDGTFINSERRVGLVKRVVRAPGEALPDFSIFRLIAQAWGCGKLFARWDSPEAAFRLLAELTRGRPCDMTGIRDYALIEQARGIQWPFPERHAEALDLDQLRRRQNRLYENGQFFHADGRARFVFAEPREMAEIPGDRFPYLLLTGRGFTAQWHTQTRTGKSPVLRQLAPTEPYVEMHPDDARRQSIAPGQDVVVESQRGRVRARVSVTPTVPRGSVFIPMHYDAANRLTLAHFDPDSHQPSYKDCAVRVRRIEPWDDV